MPLNKPNPKNTRFIWLGVWLSAFIIGLFVGGLGIFVLTTQEQVAEYQYCEAYNACADVANQCVGIIEKSYNYTFTRLSQMACGISIV